MIDDKGKVKAKALADYISRCAANDAAAHAACVAAAYAIAANADKEAK